MARYRFTFDYASGVGAWVAGDEADFDEATAAHLLVDSPGCIEPVEVEARDMEAPPADRMVRKPERRRDREGDPAEQGATSKADYKAVVDKG